MESENKKPLMGRIVAIDKYGNESEIMTGEIKAADCQPVLTGGGRMPTELESSAECTLEIKTITRKRFIKLLMSHGIARNGAKDLADYVHKKYGEYNPMLFFML